MRIDIQEPFNSFYVINMRLRIQVTHRWLSSQSLFLDEIVKQLPLRSRFKGMIANIPTSLEYQVLLESI